MVPSGIKLLILDVDGVLTDGTKVYDVHGHPVFKRFSDRDFTAIKEFKAIGITVVFLSGDNNINQEVAKSRKIPFYSSRLPTGSLSKLEVASQIYSKYGFTPDQTAFVGDDLFDVAMSKSVKISACPSNSHYLMKEISDLVLTAKSGEGCIQELYYLFVESGNYSPASEDRVIQIDSQENVNYG